MSTLVAPRKRFSSAMAVYTPPKPPPRITIRERVVCAIAPTFLGESSAGAVSAAHHRATCEAQAVTRSCDGRAVARRPSAGTLAALRADAGDDPASTPSGVWLCV